jgi:hypothetical protein
VPRLPSRSATVAATLVAALFAASPASALAQEPPRGGLFDLVGARALATGAATAGTSGTEAIFVNPGAMGVRTGYVAEVFGLNERRGAQTTSRYLGAAPIHAATADAGLNWDLTSLVTIGLSGFNLIPTGHPSALPQSMGAGLAVGTDTFIRVMADWRGTFLPNRQLANRYAAGVGGLAGGMLALRAGWMRDELLRTSWWSAGVGLITGDGFSIDLGYRQSIEAPDAREMALSFRYYPPQ